MTRQRTSKTQAPTADSTGRPGVWQNVATSYLGALLVLCPLKLGSSLNLSGVGIFPLNIDEWIFANWPPLLMPVLTALGLILVAVVDRPDPAVFRRHPHLWLPAAGLVAVSLVGMIRTTELDVAVSFLWHMISVLLMVLAVFQHVAAVPRARWVLIGCIAGGGLLSAISGWHQVLYGFEQTRQYMMEQARETGIPPNPVILDRLNQGRASGGFTYPNNFAAHLILVTPLALYLCWWLGSFVTPPRQSQWVLVILTGSVMIGAFVLTRSRAAVVAIALAAVATTAAYGWRYRDWLHRHRKVLAGTVVAGIVGLALVYQVVQRQRGLSSLMARGDYYRSAVLMFAEHPLTGVGLGEFFPWHLRLKPPAAEETRIPHNLFLYFLGQCGILGGVAALYLLLQPILLWHASWRRRIGLVSVPLWIAIFFGWMCWAIHSLADFNLQIPGSVVTMAVLPILGVDLRTGQPWKRLPAVPPNLWRVALIALGVVGLVNLWRVPGDMVYQVMYNNLSRPAAAEALVKEARVVGALQPWSPYPYDWLGKRALDQEKYELAAQAFAEAAKRTPHRAAYHAYVARCMLAMGRPAEAAEALAKALEWYPHKPVYLDLQEEVRQATAHDR